MEAAIWADLSPDALRTGIDELAELLGSLVHRPDDVTLVIPVDIREAIMRRDNSAPYTMERGGGMVGGRTMEHPGGRVDVIITGDFLVDGDATSGIRPTAAGGPRVRPAGLALLRRTVAHEAQHANMELAGTAPASRWHYYAAMKICDEHRAQFNAAQAIGTNPPSMTDVLDTLSHMGEALTAADARYQQSARLPASVTQLRDDVYIACTVFWTMVAYWAAEYREGDTIGTVPAEISGLQIWQRYVGPTWQSLAQALGRLPVTADASREALHQAARRVAAAVSTSLNHIGFRYLDIPTEAFYIDRHDFSSARE